MCAVLKWLLDPNNLTAISTLTIAAFTGALIVVGWCQARLTRQSVEVASRALTDLERPYVFVYGIHWGDAGDLNDPQRSPDDDIPYFRYTIASEGKLPAVMESLAFTAVIGHEPNKVIIHEPWANTATKIMRPQSRDDPTFAIDEMAYKKTALIALSEDGDLLRVPVMPDGLSLYVQVIIRYHGPFTKGHETSACWRYGDGGAFEDVGGSKFNYTR